MKIQFKWYDAESGKTYYTGVYEDYYAVVIIGTTSKIIIYEVSSNIQLGIIREYDDPHLEMVNITD